MDTARGTELRTLLDELERLWRAQEAPIVDVLRPGLSEATVRRRLDHVGLDAPDELVTWFGWHDGADVPERYRGFEEPVSVGPGRFRFLSLDEALEQRAWNLEVHPRPTTDVPAFADYHWHATWLPILVWQAERVAIDCTAAPDGPCPVRLISHRWEHPDPVTPTLADAVALMVAALDQGVVRWDAGAGDWGHVDAELTDEMQRSGLVW